MEPERERLECWLKDLEIVLRATNMSPVYIPTVREEWIKAVQQKPFPAPEDPENPLGQPRKPTDPKPTRKHVAKKSGARRPKSDKKKDNKKDNLQQHTEDPGDEPGDLTEEPRDDPLPPSTDPKDSQLPGTDPKDPSSSRIKP